MMMMLVVSAGCYDRHTGYVTYYPMPFHPPVWLRSARCTGDEEDITQCTYWCIRGQTDIAQCLLGDSSYCRYSRVSYISCNTSMQRVILLP